MANKFNFDSISDDALLRQLSEILKESRRVEVELVAHIGEVDRRRLYARSEASPSMYVYCTERLHLSEAEAYLRIGVARTARKHPAIWPMLQDGRLHLSGIAKLARVLTEANREALLDRGEAQDQAEDRGVGCRGCTKAGCPFDHTQAARAT